jgi:hypothetical protein
MNLLIMMIIKYLHSIYYYDMVTEFIKFFFVYVLYLMNNVYLVIT